MAHRRRPTVALLMLLLCIAPLAGCAPAVRAGSLPPTLEMAEIDGGSIAMQNGIPVPTFEFEPRLRIDLSGSWRVERAALDDALSLSDRDGALDQIVTDAAGRQAPGFDDSGWEQVDVPGTLNPPPDTRQLGGWYRRSFDVPATWAGTAAATLKFGAVNYLADVWLNGVHLGYHEGGYTPFAFDAGPALLPGEPNLLVVRVDNPPWGTRNDIVPWGLTDWWNYGGITQPVWLEAAPPIHAARADVVPHLDGADVSVVIDNRQALTRGATPAPTRSATPSASPSPSPRPSPVDSAASLLASGEPVPTATPEPTTTSVRLQVLPVRVTPDNAAAVDVRRLVPGVSRPLAETTLDAGELEPGHPVLVETSFRFGGADQWSPAFPALYVLHVRVTAPDGRIDDLWTSFGLRRLSVDPDAPRLLLNGQPVMFHGVGLHDEILTSAGREADVRGQRVHDPSTLLRQLDQAREVGADLIRAGHTPANPLLLMLADRLGFAVWEEIPLYHFTPLTFGITMRRGVPQQMLREMALRDMNHPSVVFHGLANESTGLSERTDALKALHDIDRQIDGTRLTAQAAYGSEPADPTHAPLDVAGFTFYYGVFYGASAASGTEEALQIAHQANPGKPILALEFGNLHRHLPCLRAPRRRS